MKVNGEEFKLYSVDTEQTILARLAVKFNTIPFWLLITNKGNLFEDTADISVINILDDLRGKVQNTISFKDIESEYFLWIQYRSEDVLDPTVELAKMFIIFFSEDDDTSTKILLEEIFRDSGGTDFTWDFIENTLNNRDFINASLRRDIRDLKNSVEKKVQELEKTDQDGGRSNAIINATDFSVESVVTTLIIQTEETVFLRYIFGILVVEDTILFATYQNLYKINEKFNTLYKMYELDDLKPTEKELIIVQFSRYKKRYTFREMRIVALSQREFRIDVETEDTVDMDFIEKILGSKFTVSKQENTQIKGNFSINNQVFQRDLFLDEIMNNPKFFNVYSNERFKLSKANRISLFFYSLQTQTVNFSIGQDGPDILVNVKKITSRNYVEFFRKTFISLFQTYKNNENALLNFYRKYIPNLTIPVPILAENQQQGKQTTNTRKPKNPLAIQEPLLFTRLYTRKCAKPPRILEPDEEPPANYQVLEFPLYNEGGLPPRKYVCDQTGEHKFPGLRKNTLDNKDTFSYIPCCDKTDQLQRKGSPYNTYLAGGGDKPEPTNRNIKYEHVLYKGAKIVPNENSGNLPTGILRVVGKECQRKGVFVGPNAFIDCISRISQKETGDIDSEEDRKKILIKIRRKLIPEFCAQNNFDLNTDDWISWFRDPNRYFEPRRFYRAVEEYFKINIYFFERSTPKVTEIISDTGELVFEKSTSSNGILGLPNIPSHGVYIDPKRFTRRASAFVYVHTGSAIDSVPFPHCEYITNISDAMSTSAIVEKIYRNILIFSRRDYIDQEIAQNVVSQFTDSTGRVVRLRMKNNDIRKLSKPMLPLGVPIEKLEYRPETDLLATHAYMKRLSRTFVEYCMIKFAQQSQLEDLDVDTFLAKYSIVDSTFVYPELSPRYKLEDFDTVFSDERGKIIFESEDTKRRIAYSMRILKKRNGLQPFIEEPFIHGYYENVLDFDSLTLSGDSFRNFVLDPVQGKSFTNFLADPANDSAIILKDKIHEDLNGYFEVFTDLTEINKENLSTAITAEDFSADVPDKYYLWDALGYSSYSVRPGTGKIIVVFKYNSVTYYLVKRGEVM